MICLMGCELVVMVTMASLLGCDDETFLGFSWSRSCLKIANMLGGELGSGSFVIRAALP